MLILTWLFTIITYFILGSGSAIIAYNPIAYIKLFVLHIILLGPLFFVNLYILKKVISGWKFFSLAILTSIIAITLSVFLNVEHAFYLYITIGDYLRDFHDINIYWMDAGGWTIAILAYSAQLINFILFLVGEKIIKRIPRLNKLKK